MSQSWIIYNVSGKGFETSQKKLKKACHNCRSSHIGCDGNRPCSNCAKKHRTCFDYDKSLLTRGKMTRNTTTGSAKERSNQAQVDAKGNCEQITEKRKHSSLLVEIKQEGASSSSSSSVDEPSSVDELEIECRRALQELKQVQQVLNTEKNLFDQLTAQINTTQKQKEEEEQQQQQLLVCQPPRNELAIDLWGPTTQLKNPIFIWCPQTLNIVGCNEAFCNFTQRTKDQLKNRFNMLELIPLQGRGAWEIVVRWILAADINYVRSINAMEFGDGTTGYIKIHNHYERSFVWVELEQVDYMNDEFQVNRSILPATYHASITQNVKTHPEESFKRFLSLLWKIPKKSVYSDQIAIQEQTLHELEKSIRLHSPPPQYSPPASGLHLQLDDQAMMEILETIEQQRVRKQSSVSFQFIQ